MTSREEIAARLRELRHKTYYREEIVESICDAISIADPVNTFREPEDVYKLLADLIDPTCHMVVTLEQEASSKYKPIGICSNCGHFKSDYGEFPKAFNYCPDCGARVVRDNHD